MDDIRPGVASLRRECRAAFTCFDPSSFCRHVSLIDAVGKMHEGVDRTDINDLSNALWGHARPPYRPFPHLGAHPRGPLTRLGSRAE